MKVNIKTQNSSQSLYSATKKYKCLMKSRYGWLLFNKVINVKSDSHFPKKCFICFNERPLTMMKNVFYFILKALFILKVFKSLSWLFSHVEKTASLES